jgi:Ca2+:H+ antiporter
VLLIRFAPSSTMTKEPAMTALPAAATNKPPAQKRTLRYRFRKAWRAIFLAALAPFFVPGIIPFVDPGLVKLGAGVLTLIPLATFLEVVTEDLIERLGQLVGGLLHAFFGNIAYFVITISVLIQAASLPADSPDRSGLVRVVQSSIAGNIVIDILFILGVSIFIGGIRNGRMQFSPEYSNQYAEMLLIAVIALALPSLAYVLPVGVGLNAAKLGNNAISSFETTSLSNLTAVILIVAYIGYLGWTVFHFRDKPARPQEPEETSRELRGDLIGPLAENVAPIEEEQQREQLQADETLRRQQAATVAPAVAMPADGSPAPASAIAAIVNKRIQREAARRRRGRKTVAQQEAEDVRRGLALWELAILILGTGGVVYISENMADSLRETLSTGQLFGSNTFFIGFIIVPIAANLVELSAATSTAWRDRMETCLAVTAGSAIQVALLIAPMLVLAGHVLGLGDMNLVFGLFILAIFGLIAYFFQLITVDGETTWFEGLQFTSFFAIIAVVAYFAGSSS